MKAIYGFTLLDLLITIAIVSITATEGRSWMMDMMIGCEFSHRRTLECGQACAIDTATIVEGGGG